MNDYKIAKRQIEVSVGESVRIIVALKCHPAVLVFPGWDIHRAA